MSGTKPTTLLIQPRDPAVFRDARPFDATPGARATTLTWPWPQTIAGALRTQIGETIKTDWGSQAGPTTAHRVAFAGPLLAARSTIDDRWSVYFPAPNDAVLYRKDPEVLLKVMRLRPAPYADGEGSDLPLAGLQPMEITEDIKPDNKIAFWSYDDFIRWLATDDQDPAPPTDSINHLTQDTRIHIKIDPERGAAAGGHLFATTGLEFHEKDMNNGGCRELALLCQIYETPSDWSPSNGWISVGGERRLSSVSYLTGDLWPTPPSLPASAGNLLRLVLVTPSLFERGWLPGWIDSKTLEGHHPVLQDLRLRLVGAAMGRREAISGWRTATRKSRFPHTRKAGPRATRYAAPAGSVYFFEIVGGKLTEELWRELWLMSIADLEWDRRSGYGLAVPGIWSNEGERG